ncbi:MAG: hypothetical protein D6762_01895 [Candidatus Neomarinimicrobiota bacterium]|nr:MAG: hypothetical protein D6762_01895 [Candidatus Neomarinimicrobiota bacterium]
MKRKLTSTSDTDPTGKPLGIPGRDLRDPQQTDIEQELDQLKIKLKILREYLQGHFDSKTLQTRIMEAASVRITPKDLGPSYTNQSGDHHENNG